MNLSNQFYIPYRNHLLLACFLFHQLHYLLLAILSVSGKGQTIGIA